MVRLARFEEVVQSPLSSHTKQRGHKAMRLPTQSDRFWSRRWGLLSLIIFRSTTPTATKHAIMVVELVFYCSWAASRARRLTRLESERS